MFKFQKTQEIQRILYAVDIQDQKVFGKKGRGLYQTEAEKIAKELNRSTNLDFIRLSIEAVFRDLYYELFLYDPEKIERAAILISELYEKDSKILKLYRSYMQNRNRTKTESKKGK